MARTIREEDEYSGVRVTMKCEIARALVKPSLDINVGDPVTPGPGQVDLPSQRPDLPPVRLLGYPIETVLAEKLCTAIALGEGNTRVRDYADIFILTGKHSLRREAAWAALEATSKHRGVELRPLSEVIGDLAITQRRPYEAFRRRLEPDSGLPIDFREVVEGVVAFADPLVESGQQEWVSAERT